MSQISVGPPDLKSADPRSVALAKYLRNHKLLKQRTAIMNGQHMDIFRYKRAVRALQDPAYAKARARNPVLPEVDTPEKMSEAVRLLPLNRLAFNVVKLETDFAIQVGLKPVSGVPCVMVASDQRMADEEYFVWFYSPVPLTLYLKGVGMLLGVVALIAFPLWPFKARKLAWLLSLWALIFVGLMIVLAVVRLIFFVITLVVARPGIWIFPNLFADVGFIDSFKPLYAWRGQRTLPKKDKKKKRPHKPMDPTAAGRLNAQLAAAASAAMAKQPAGAGAAGAGAGAAGAGAGAGAGTGAPGGAGAAGVTGPNGQQLSPEQQEAMAKLQANPMLQQLLARSFSIANQRAEERVREKIAKEKITDEATIKQIHAVIMQEELQKVQADLRKVGVQAKSN